LRETLGHESAMESMERAIDLAATHIREGRAVAFGEIGRPHFPVGAEIIRACNDIVLYAMAQAKSLGSAVVLHTEDPTPATFAEFAAMAAQARLEPRYVVKHHSTPLTRPEDNSGLVPSILAKEELAAQKRGQGGSACGRSLVVRRGGNIGKNGDHDTEIDEGEARDNFRDRQAQPRIQAREHWPAESEATMNIPTHDYRRT